MLIIYRRRCAKCALIGIAKILNWQELRYKGDKRCAVIFSYNNFRSTIINEYINAWNYLNEVLALWTTISAV